MFFSGCEFDQCVCLVVVLCFSEKVGIWTFCRCFCGSRRKSSLGQGVQEEEKRNGFGVIGFGEAFLLLRSLSQQQGQHLDPCGVCLADCVHSHDVAGLHEAAGAAAAGDGQLTLSRIHGAELYLRICGRVCFVLHELGSTGRISGCFSGFGLLGGCECGGSELALCFWSEFDSSYAGCLLDLAVHWPRSVWETCPCFARQHSPGLSHGTLLRLAWGTAVHFPLWTLSRLFQECWKQGEWKPRQIPCKQEEEKLGRLKEGPEHHLQNTTSSAAAGLANGFTLMVQPMAQTTATLFMACGLLSCKCLWHKNCSDRHVLSASIKENFYLQVVDSS